MNNTILEKKKRVSDQVLYALIQLSSFLSIFILLVIIGYILYRGMPAFDFSYLVNTTSIINDTICMLSINGSFSDFSNFPVKFRHRL